MISQRIIEWINQELDAETSATKSTRLYRHLEKNPEAQAYFNDLKKVHGILESVDQVEPPASLKPGIMNAVRASAKPVVKKTNIVESILSRFSSPAVPRYGFAVASGICVGMVLFAVMTGGIDSAPDGEQVAGTMGIVSAPTGTVTDYAIFEGVSTTSSIQVVSQGLQIYIEAEINGTDAHELAIAFPSDAYAIVGVRRQAGKLESVRSQEGSLSAHIDGSGRLVVELDRVGSGAPPVHIELRREGHLLWEKSISTTVTE